METVRGGSTTVQLPFQEIQTWERVFIDEHKLQLLGRHLAHRFSAGEWEQTLTGHPCRREAYAMLGISCQKTTTKKQRGK